MCNSALATFASLLNRYQRVHGQDSNFNVVCGVNGCGCTYKNFYGYRSHLQRHHARFWENAPHIRQCTNDEPPLQQEDNLQIHEDPANNLEEEIRIRWDNYLDNRRNNVL